MSLFFLFFGHIDFDMHFFELLLGDGAGRAHKHVARVSVHREGDDFSDARLVGKKHDDSVNRVRYLRAAVRRT